MKRLRSIPGLALVVGLGLVGGSGGGCGTAPDSTPDGAVRELATLLDEDSYEPSARRRAFELLDQKARRTLAARARTASESSGRKLAPEDMIVPGGTTMLFDVETVKVVESDARRAVVEVRGAGGEHARIRVVREGDAWRVVLPLAEAS